MDDLNWRNYIHVDPDVLVGKPVVRGTRLSVDFLLSLLAAGWTTADILENYPTLTPDGLRAVFAFAADIIHNESFFVLPATQR